MVLLSLVAALVIEQLRPLRRGNPVNSAYGRFTDRLAGQLNTGEPRDGAIAWAIAVVPAALAAGGIYLLLDNINAILAWVWNVAVLYVVLGFRQFSHYGTGIMRALKDGDADRARALLGEWTGQPADEFTVREVARVSIEQGLLAAHRHVFGVLVWFVVFGVAGAVFYRAAGRVADAWGQRRDEEFGPFGDFAARAFRWIEWVPARLTALSFAIVGDFEDAVYCWRTQAGQWPDRTQGIILASAAGALGVKLGDPVHRHGTLEFRPELGVMEEADADYLESAVGLAWRAIVMWMLLIALATVASWF